MTAEIAVLNRGAVALASDSAVTVPSGEGTKIYNSANKVMMLSDTEPVGIMTYGSADFTTVPWETVVKEYRRRRGSSKCSHLSEYAEAFLAFLQSSGVEWLSPDEQTETLRHGMERALGEAKERIRDRLDERLEHEVSLTEAQVSRTAARTINLVLQLWIDAPYLPGHDDTTFRRVLRDYRSMIDETRARVFEELPLSEAAEAALRRIAASSATRFRRHESTSGIVIAGFGDDDVFPSLEAFLVNGVALEKVQYVRDEAVCVRISREDAGAALVPFAQSGAVTGFMRGVDPSYQDRFDRYLAGLLREMPRVVSSVVRPAQRPLVKQRLGAFVQSVRDELGKRMEAFQQEHHVRPVVSTVASMPKEEMAAMAEALVNLASFRQKITMQEETVGGPIDVAVISKGDGFVWVKRKHYFDASLNPRFLARYYRSVSMEEE